MILVRGAWGSSLARCRGILPGGSADPLQLQSLLVKRIHDATVKRTRFGLPDSDLEPQAPSRNPVQPYPCPKSTPRTMWTVGQDDGFMMEI